MQQARQAEDETLLEKLKLVTSTIQKVSAPGANVALIEALIQAENEEAMQALIQENRDEITDDFMQFLMNLLNQMQEQPEQDATAQKLKDVYRQVLRFSMKRNLESQS